MADSGKTERLVVLVSPEEKDRLAELARQRRTSVAAVVRQGIALLDRVPPGPDGPQEHRGEWHQGDGSPAANAGGDPGGDPDAVTTALTPAQIAILERFADKTAETMRRADLALDVAFKELEATRAQLAGRRHDLGEPL